MSLPQGKAWYVVQWKTKYETSDTRKTDYMGWYKKSTKLVGIGIGLTLGHQDNTRMLGLWYLIETLASLSAMEYRGWLIRDGRPMDEEDMHGLIPTVSAEDFAEALKWFSQERINWLTLADFPAISPQPPADLPEGGKASGKPPADLPEGGKNSAREREREKLERENSDRERGALSVPSVEAVLQWGASERIDAEFLKTKHGEYSERGAWFIHGRLLDWKKRFKRFWDGEDGKVWRAKNKKKSGAPAGVSLEDMRKAGEA